MQVLTLFKLHCECGMINAWLARWQHDRRFGALIIIRRLVEVSTTVWPSDERSRSCPSGTISILAASPEATYLLVPLLNCSCWLSAVSGHINELFYQHFYRFLISLNSQFALSFLNRWQYGRKSVKLLLAFASNEFVYTRRMFIIWCVCVFIFIFMV